MTNTIQTYDELNKRDHEEQTKRRLSIKTMKNPVIDNQELAENHTKEFRQNLFNIMQQ
jgi:hypothetical protein